MSTLGKAYTGLTTYSTERKVLITDGRLVFIFRSVQFVVLAAAAVHLFLFHGYQYTESPTLSSERWIEFSMPSNLPSYCYGDPFAWSYDSYAPHFSCLFAFTFIRSHWAYTNISCRFFNEVRSRVTHSPSILRPKPGFAFLVPGWWQPCHYNHDKGDEEWRDL